MNMRALSAVVLLVSAAGFGSVACGGSIANPSGADSGPGGSSAENGDAGAGIGSTSPGSGSGGGSVVVGGGGNGGGPSSGTGPVGGSGNGGSGPGSSGGGTSGSSGSGSGSSGGGGSSVVCGCPSSPEADPGACSAACPDITCNYGDTQCVCAGGGWACSGSAMVGSTDAGVSCACPASPQGGGCDPSCESTGCNYGDTQCFCSQGAWLCGTSTSPAPAPSCPASQPMAGSACAPGPVETCPYGGTTCICVPTSTGQEWSCT